MVVSALGSTGFSVWTSTQPPQLVTSITLNETSINLHLGETSELTATVLPEDADNKAVSWESSNSDVATVDGNGVVTAIADGNCTITCKAKDGSGVKATCEVNVSSSHEYVDLGLPSGTLWATCNVGAENPEDYGDYFAWGETTGYNDGKTTFSWSTYKYYDTLLQEVTKYCTKSDYAYLVDNKKVLEPEDDAATVNWGVEWQMPSLEQFSELINSEYTTTTWTTLNGVNGRMIVSKSNGNRIFLPAAGHRSDTSLYVGIGHYWSRSLYPDRPLGGCILYFYSSDFGASGFYRYHGQSVRPVRVQTR
jgi:hypothetical protein